MKTKITKGAERDKGAAREERFGETKKGVRWDSKTKQFVLNKWINGRTRNDATGCTEFRAAVEFAEKFATEQREMRSAESAHVEPNAKLSVVIERWKFSVKNMRATEAHKKNVLGCLQTVLRLWPLVPGVCKDAKTSRFEDLRPSQVSLLELQAWVSYALDEEGLSNSYVNRCISTVFRQLFDHAVDLGLIAEQRKPTRKLKCEENDYAVKDIRSLADIDKILSALGGHNALAKTILDDPRYKRGETKQTDWQKAFDENPAWAQAMIGDLLETDDTPERAKKIKCRISYYAQRAKLGADDYGQAQHVRDLVEGLAFSGLRVGEARRLKVKHIDLAAKFILVRDDVAEKGGIRSVPINHPRQLVLFSRLVAEAGPDRDAHLFKVKTAADSLATACRATGVPHISHHALRHFFASWLLMQEVSLPVVAEILGHHDNGMLAGRLYCHLLDELRRKQIAKLSAVPSNVVPLLRSADDMSDEELLTLMEKRKTNHNLKVI